jgi:hypothetical protein
MQANYLQRLTDDDWPALTGVRRELFEHIFRTYCKDSAINKPCVFCSFRLRLSLSSACIRWKLFRVLYLLKTNPTYQQFRVETGVKDKRVIFKSVWRHVHILADRMLRDAESLWALRRQLSGQPPEYAKALFGDVTFLVDSFPIVILRSKLREWRLATYQGKYKEFIMKCQVCLFVCDLWFTRALCASGYL